MTSGLGRFRLPRGHAFSVHRLRRYADHLADLLLRQQILERRHDRREPANRASVGDDGAPLKVGLDRRRRTVAGNPGTWPEARSLSDCPLDRCHRARGTRRNRPGRSPCPCRASACCDRVPAGGGGACAATTAVFAVKMARQHSVNPRTIICVRVLHLVSDGDWLRLKLSESSPTVCNLRSTCRKLPKQIQRFSISLSERRYRAVAIGLARRCVIDAPMSMWARMRAWSRHRPDGARLRAVTIVNGSTVRCVPSDQGEGMPLVNASSSRRTILRTMRRERSEVRSS